MTSPEPRPERGSGAIEVVKQEKPFVNQAAIDLLTSWLENDDEVSIAEQRETWEHLQRALDDDRLPDCTLFPEFGGSPDHRSSGDGDEPERVAADGLDHGN